MHPSQPLLITPPPPQLALSDIFSKTSLSAQASFEVRSPKRLQVQGAIPSIAHLALQSHDADVAFMSAPSLACCASLQPHHRCCAMPSVQRVAWLIVEQPLPNSLVPCTASHIGTMFAWDTRGQYIDLASPAWSPIITA